MAVVDIGVMAMRVRQTLVLVTVGVRLTGGIPW